MNFFTSFNVSPPNAKKKHCFGKKIKMMEFNPFYNNESALFMSLRYGVKHNTI